MKSEALCMAALVVLLITPMVAMAVEIQSDTNSDTTTHPFELTGYSPHTYIIVGHAFTSGVASVYDDHVSITSLSFGDTEQTFGVGIQSGNATISTINPGDVKFTLSCTDSQTCYLYYYYTSNIPVYAVQIDTTGNARVIPSNEYSSSTTTFNAASNPAVYQDGTSNYLEVKVTYHDPTSISFFLGVPSGSGGGGGDGGSGSPITPDYIGSNTPVGSALTLDAIIPMYDVAPGESKQQNIIVNWTGATRIMITDVKFLEEPSWFTVDKPLPIIGSITAENEVMQTSFPVTVKVPEDAEKTDRTIPVQITANAGGNTLIQQRAIHVNTNPTNGLVVLGFFGAIGIIVVALAAKKRR